MKVARRLRMVARKVLDSALPVERDEVVAFYAGVENLDLAYAFAAECEVRGVETLVQTCGDYISQVKLLEAPLDSFQRLPKVPEAIVKVADWLVYMSGAAFDNSIYQRPDLKERVLEVRKSSIWSLDRLLQLCLANRTHLVVFLDPNLQQAQALGKSYLPTRKMFLDSLDIDYDALTELGQRIVGVMGRGGEVHVTCPRGTDLRLRADGRAWINDDGKPVSRSGSVNQYVHNLPVGEVFVAPREDTAFGVAYPKSLPGSVLDGSALSSEAERKP